MAENLPPANATVSDTKPVLYEPESATEHTTSTSTIEDKIDALLVLNGIDPQIIEEGGIAAVKRAIGRSS